MELIAATNQEAVPTTSQVWELVLLDSVAKRGSGHTPDKAFPEYWGGSIKWVSLQDTHLLDRRYISCTTETITQAGLANSSAQMHKQGTVILSRDAGVGKSAIMSCDMAVSQHFMAWTCGTQLFNQFLYYHLQFLKPEFERIAMGSTIKTIGLPYFIRFKIPLPAPTEQRAIAAALTDADGLIDSLERLIAKKRHIKLGTMQELLTAKRRLPGIEGEWSVLKLGATCELSARIGWQGLTTAEYQTTGPVCLVTGTEFNNGSIDWEQCCFVSMNRYAQDKHIQLHSKDVLVTKDGTVGKIAYVDFEPDLPTTLNSGIFVLRPKVPCLTAEWLYCTMISPVFRHFIKLLSAGSTINHLYQKDFINFEFPVPPTLPEQLAIATILSDMDSEIAALETKLEKARHIKQGMMQQLLTGRIRLPVETPKTAEVHV